MKIAWHKLVLFPVLILLPAGFLLDKLITQTQLQWIEASGYRWAALPVPVFGDTGFEKLQTGKTGILFRNSLTDEQIMSNRHLLNGSGVAVGDVDADGLCDIYFCRLDGDNALYRNLGNWKFEDISANAGVLCPDRFSTGAVFADIDGDGDLDLFVTALGGPNSCYRNDGTGRFIDITEKVGLSSRRGRTGSTTITLADIDGDADLDMYVTNYKSRSRKDQGRLVFNSAGMILARVDFGEPDILYLNDGEGNFTAVKLSADTFRDERGRRIAMPRDWGLTARFQDFDDDGDPDLYVCNDFLTPDRIWLNDGQGTFQAMPALAVRSISASAMAVDFSDIDRDGDVDFFVLEMLSRSHQMRKMQMGAMPAKPSRIGEIRNRPQLMRNTLFLNRGDNTYAEIARFSGLEASEWSWSGLFLDVDLDGFEDVLITTGHAFDVQDGDTQDKISAMKVPTIDELRQTIFLYPRLQTPNFVFRNRGDLTFEEKGSDWGFENTGISQGMAVADLDHDGDLDVITNNFQSAAGVYRNKTNASRIAVRLNGQPPNTQGIGAKVRLLDGELIQSKEIVAGGSYVSGSEPMVAFAAGDGASDATLEVIWRSGKRSVINDIQANRIYQIDESLSEPVATETKSDFTAIFEDVSDLIAHRHHETPYDDFYRQPLLPNRLSQLGPGVSWYDLDDDQDDDLIIACGRNGQLAAYRNNAEDGFERLTGPVWDQKVAQDLTTVLFTENQPGVVSLLAGMSNYETPSEEMSAMTSYQLSKNGLKTSAVLPDHLSCTGPMSLADYDGDGDLDLFVGGRTVPGRYPEPASSRLYKLQNGDYELDNRNSETLQNIGQVCGSVFSDLDADGDPELILAVEWGPPTVFRNDHGVYVDATQDYGLSDYRGWWNGVTTGDFNEDGRLDIVATNWGLNSKYSCDSESPLQIRYADFDDNGSLDIVEAHFEPALQAVVPERGRSCMTTAMPYLASRVNSYAEYGKSSIDDILGADKLAQAGKLTANTLAHTLFINHGDRFEAVPLPRQAQFAPAFAVTVADFDGDGHEDIFLSQNFYPSQAETGRSDAGRGLWLQGDGRGNFQAIPGHKTGIMVYGDQRGAAVSDYNADGRVDLVITQNGARTRLFKNVSGQPGLRIRLQGSNSNRHAVGASLQLVFDDRKGPVREIHRGSGYWSQDSAVLVMGQPEPANAVIVRWPGGRLTESVLPAYAREIAVTTSGVLEVIR